MSSTVVLGGRLPCGDSQVPLSQLCPCRLPWWPHPEQCGWHTILPLRVLSPYLVALSPGVPQWGLAGGIPLQAGHDSLEAWGQCDLLHWFGRPRW